jgi:hypothetical protein
MGIQRTYRPDEDMPVDDPGNVLRAELSKVEVDFDINRKFGELLYTAEERGLIDFHIDDQDRVTLLRLMKLAELDDRIVQRCRM